LKIRRDRHPADPLFHCGTDDDIFSTPLIKNAPLIAFAKSLADLVPSNGKSVLVQTLAKVGIRR